MPPLLYSDTMAKQLGTQAFARALRKAAPADQETLNAWLAPHSAAPAQTGAATLVGYTLAAIERGDTLYKLRELFGAVNDTLRRPGMATPGVVSNAFIRIRAAAKAKHGDDSDIFAAAKKRLVDDKKYFAAVIAATDAKLAERTAAPTELKWGTIKAFMEAVRDGGTAADAVLFLQLASGARIGEITARSTFEARPGVMVRQMGVEKARGVTEIDKELLFIRPNEFVARFAAMRDQLKDRSNSMIVMAVARRLKALEPVMGTAVVSHDMRRLYANISYAVYGRQQTLISWISTRLGHDGLKSAAHYMTIAPKLTPADVDEIRDMNAQGAEAPAPAAAEPEAKEAEPAQDAAGAIPRNIRKRDGLAGERLSATVAALEATGMRYNQKMLKGYGYSSATVDAWYKSRKGPAAE